jgi:hypothetical protein
MLTDIKLNFRYSDCFKAIILKFYTETAYGPFCFDMTLGEGNHRYFEKIGTRVKEEKLLQMFCQIYSNHFPF